MQIKISDSTDILKQIFERKIIDNTSSMIKYAFDAMLDFKTEYKIEGCSREEESDELLAEYGVYSWNPKEDPQFEFTLTRQILIEENEEYFQLKIKLAYNLANFKEIESMNFWSMNYENIEKWKMEVQKTDGFKIANKTELLNRKIYLGMT